MLRRVAVTGIGAVSTNGIGREAFLSATKDGISGKDAFAEMKKFNYGPDFLHPEFKKFVETFDVKKSAASAVTATQQQ